MIGLLPRYSPIGIDVGARSIKGAQLRRTRGGWRVFAAANVPRLEPDAPVSAAEALRVAEVLGRQGFVGRSAVLSVPHDKLVTSFLEIPPRTAEAPIDQIARMEFARINRLPQGAFEVGWWELPFAARGQQVTRALAAGCAHAEADPLLEAFEAAGLDPLALEVPWCAAARACSPLIHLDGTAALLDVGWSASKLVLLRRGVIVYVRTLTELGLRRVVSDLAEELRLEVEVLEPLLLTPETAEGDGTPVEVRQRLAAAWDGLVEEVRASFGYVEQQYPEEPVRQVVLIGGGAALASAEQHLSAALGAEVVTASPHTLLPCEPAILQRCTSPAMTPAIGLAGFPCT